MYIKVSKLFSPSRGQEVLSAVMNHNEHSPHTNYYFMTESNLFSLGKAKMYHFMTIVVGVISIFTKIGGFMPSPGNAGY